MQQALSGERPISGTQAHRYEAAAVHIQKGLAPMDTRLARSDTDKILGGVCGGLGRYFGIDSTIVRLVFVLSVLLGGVSPLIYLVLWIVMPRDSAYVPPTPPTLPNQDATGEWQYDPYTGVPIKK